MEKIRKALDRARAERGRGTLEPARSSSNDDAEALGFEAASSNLAYARSAAPEAAGPSAERRAPARRFAPDPAVLEAHRVLRQDSTSPAAEAFRLLRTQVLQRMEERNWRTLAIVSPGEDDSRPVIAANLASAIAADRRYHALLVDLDLRSPRVGSLYGLEPEHGVDDVLAGAASVDACLYRLDGFERLTLLPARVALPRGSELLAGPVSRQLTGELRDRYPDRLVICSLAPVLATDEALAFLPQVDCALLVVTEARTRRADVAQAMNLLRRVPIVGTVLGGASALKRSRE